MITTIRNIVFALLLAAFGIYVLRVYAGLTGLIVGGLAVLGALGVAFPTQMDSVAPRLKGLLVLLIPVVKGAVPGGSRADDPPLPPKDGADK